LAAHTDDGFHEIQLNGKQLVFLFMAATVVSVVIFLCGVLVGRGVRNQQAAEADVVQLAATEPIARPEATTGPPVQAGSDPRVATPPPPADEDDLSFPERLDGSGAPAERLKTPEQIKAQDARAAADRALEPMKAPEPARAPVPARQPERGPSTATSAATPANTSKPAAQGAPPATASAKPAPPAAAPAAPPASVPAAAAGSATSEPQGSGYAVQVAALNARSEADTIAKRLASKGYAVYVMTPASGTPQVFRVRVGKFGSRGEAETVAAKLEKEEQFKPWITR
jgi:cell division septation protein DedD